jgi:hypothetical protein
MGSSMSLTLNRWPVLRLGSTPLSRFARRGTPESRAGLGVLLPGPSSPYGANPSLLLLGRPKAGLLGRAQRASWGLQGRIGLLVGVRHEPDRTATFLPAEALGGQTGNPQNLSPPESPLTPIRRRAGLPTTTKTSLQGSQELSLQGSLGTHPPRHEAPTGHGFLARLPPLQGFQGSSRRARPVSAGQRNPLRRCLTPGHYPPSAPAAGTLPPGAHGTPIWVRCHPLWVSLSPRHPPLKAPRLPPFRVPSSLPSRHPEALPQAQHRALSRQGTRRSPPLGRQRRPPFWTTQVLSPARS